MPCYKPLSGVRQSGGRISFRRPPWPGEEGVTVSCGQCIGCRLERSRQWAVRCVHEAQMHESNSFITLTYDEANLPENRSLDVAHWQDFAKRVRHSLGPFRFFHCGEYGDNGGEPGGRPHLHSAVFGLDFRDDRRLWKTQRGNRLYVSDRLTGLWGKGFAVIGNLTWESAAYVARYVVKKQTGPPAKEFYEYVDEATGEVHDRKPPYTTMSRRPGIGKPWLEKFNTDVYPSDQVVLNGREFRPPRYYDNELAKEDPELLEQLKESRVENAEKHAENNTPDRLAVRRKVQEARLALLKRGGTE